MKRITLLAVFSGIFFFLSNSQDKLPSFGKIDKADLEMKDCAYDPGAEAFVLIDLGDVKYSYLTGSGWISESNYRVRIKVLKEKGIHQAEVKIHYYSRERRNEVTSVSGVSFNLDAAGNVEETKLEKSAIFDKPVDKDYNEVSFALPNVKVGSVFEYKYKLTRNVFSEIPNWTFQQSIPVRYSAYNIVIPEYFEFTVQSTKRQEMERKDGSTADEGTWYIMRNIPGLKDEPYSFCRDNYLQRVEFQLSRIQAPGYYKEFRTTWAKIIEELLDEEDFGGAIKKNLHGKDDLDQQLARLTSNKEKIRAIYKYVQSNMDWNGHYAIYSRSGIKDAWDKKNGNIADINFILLNLLKDAGIAAKPVLASTKDNGPINTFYPFLHQFNCVMVYAADGDDVYIMNAADKFNPYDLIPYDVLYTSALLVAKGEGEGGILDLNGNRKFINNIFFNCNVDADGKLAGQSIIKSIDYARNVRMETLKKAKLKALLEDNEGITIKVDSIELKNEKDETLPLEQTVSFSGSLQSSGEYYFLPFGLFSGIGKNQFVAEDRVMDIDFNFPRTYDITGTFVLPENYVVNELPKNTRMIMPDTSIILLRKAQQNDNIVTIKLTLEFTSPGYTSAGYPYIKEFFKKMYDILDERIVLKKK